MKSDSCLFSVHPGSKSSQIGSKLRVVKTAGVIECK
jgi:hypothetical protein